MDIGGILEGDDGHYTALLYDLLTGVALRRIRRRGTATRDELIDRIESWAERNESDGLDEVKLIFEGLPEAEYSIVGALARRIADDFARLGLLKA